MKKEQKEKILKVFEALKDCLLDDEIENKDKSIIYAMYTNVLGMLMSWK